MRLSGWPVATADDSSSGHFAMEAIAKATGAKYRHVTYDGGNPAVVATVAGEGEVTTQLAPEQAEMINGKRLRPLAVVADRPLTIEGVGTIPPITEFVKDFPQVTTAFGIFIPKGVPAGVVTTVERLWAERIATSGKLTQYAVQKWPCSRRRTARPRTPRSGRQSCPTRSCCRMQAWRR